MNFLLTPPYKRYNNRSNSVSIIIMSNAGRLLHQRFSQMVKSGATMRTAGISSTKPVVYAREMKETSALKLTVRAGRVERFQTYLTNLLL